ncbi:MAG: inorganic phosphate transporter [Archaeoglobaceae archaeon]
MTEIISLIAFLLLAFSIGSNDTSNAFGICIGCKIINLKKAVILLFVLALIGLTIQGGKVIETVGEKITTLNAQISSIALIVSALVVILSNFRGNPLSTHQVIVGGISGVAVAFGAPVSLKTLSEIILSWILSPILAGILAILIFYSLERILKAPTLIVEKTLRHLMLCSAMLIAYNMGANELATAIAPLVATGIDRSIAILGPFFLALGALALSRRIAETLCKKITTIDPKSGFSAQFAAGLSVYTFTVLGMPVSTTYSLVGGISAIGLSKGVRAIKIGKLREIILGWIFAPVIAFVFGYVISKAFIFYY